MKRASHLNQGETHEVLSAEHFSPFDVTEPRMVRNFFGTLGSQTLRGVHGQKCRDQGFEGLAHSDFFGPSRVRRQYLAIRRLLAMAVKCLDQSWL